MLEAGDVQCRFANRVSIDIGECRELYTRTQVGSQPYGFSVLYERHDDKDRAPSLADDVSELATPRSTNELRHTIALVGAAVYRVCDSPAPARCRGWA